MVALTLVVMANDQLDAGPPAEVVAASWSPAGDHLAMLVADRCGWRRCFSLRVCEDWNLSCRMLLPSSWHQRLWIDASHPAGIAWSADGRVGVVGISRGESPELATPTVRGLFDLKTERWVEHHQLRSEEKATIRELIAAQLADKRRRSTQRR